MCSENDLKASLEALEVDFGIEDIGRSKLPTPYLVVEGKWALAIGFLIRRMWLLWATLKTINLDTMRKKEEAEHKKTLQSNCLSIEAFGKSIFFKKN